MLGGQSTLGNDLETQREGGDEYVHLALIDSQKDTAHDHVCTLTTTRGDIGIDLESVVIHEDRAEAHKGKPAHGYFYNENDSCGDELQGGSTS